MGSLRMDDLLALGGILALLIVPPAVAVWVWHRASKLDCQELELIGVWWIWDSEHRFWTRQSPLSDSNPAEKVMEFMKRGPYALRVRPTLDGGTFIRLQDKGGKRLYAVMYAFATEAPSKTPCQFDPE